MAKQIKQFRYYKQNNLKNYPTNISIANLASGSIFSKYMPVIQLGIQSLPGTKFYLNNSNEKNKSSDHSASMFNVLFDF